MSPTRQLVGELISEALAVCIIITLGCSAAAMLILYDPSPYQNAYWGVCIAWGMAVTLAILCDRQCQRHPCQPRRHLGLGAVSRVCMEKGAALLGRATAWRLFGGDPRLHPVSARYRRL